MKKKLDKLRLLSYRDISIHKGFSDEIVYDLIYLQIHRNY